MTRTPPQKVIFITGMHRSGTSLFSGIFQHLGYSHGDKLLPSSQFNPLGYWEDSELVAFNDRLLHASGMKWDSIRLIDFQVENTNYWSAFEEEAKQLLLQKIGHHSGLVFKDPRLCNLLSFWYRMLDELAIPHQTILLFRNPEEVRLSLQRRNGFHYGKTDWLYWIYYTSAIQQLQNEKAFILYLEDIIQNNEGVIRELTTFLEIEFIAFDQVLSLSNTIQRTLLTRKPNIFGWQTKQKILLIHEEVFEWLYHYKGTFLSNDIPYNQIQQWKKQASQFQSIFTYVQFAGDELNHLSIIRKANDRVAQLFYGNAEDEMQEINSVFSTIDHLPLEFNIPQDNTFHLLRFDPLNDYVHIHIKEIRFFEMEKERKPNYKITSNAMSEADGEYLFNTVDSQIYLHFQDGKLKGIDRLQIRLDYLAIGVEAQNKVIELVTSGLESYRNRLEISIMDEKKWIAQLELWKKENEALASSNALLAERNVNLTNQIQGLSNELEYQKNWLKLQFRKIILSMTMPFRKILKKFSE